MNSKIFLTALIFAASALPTLAQAGQTIDPYSAHEAPYYTAEMATTQDDARQAGQRANERSQRDLQRNYGRMMGDDAAERRTQSDAAEFNK